MLEMDVGEVLIRVREGLIGVGCMPQLVLGPLHVTVVLLGGGGINLGKQGRVSGTLNVAGEVLVGVGAVWGRGGVGVPSMS